MDPEMLAVATQGDIMRDAWLLNVQSAQLASQSVSRTTNEFKALDFCLNQTLALIKKKNKKKGYDEKNKDSSHKPFSPFFFFWPLEWDWEINQARI